MIEVSVQEAKTRLSHLLDLVEDGEDVVIRRHGKPVAHLSALSSGVKSPLDAMRGEFILPEGWGRPLSEAETDAFWEGKD